MAENVEQGSRILLSDGLIELRVSEVNGADVICEIINGGMLGEHKGINLPGIPVRVPSLTEKDADDLEFALKNDVDAIAVSFVRTAEDVRLVRNRVAAYGGETWIIAKLEKPQAIEHLDAILAVADGIMVARGDLGVEVPPEEVPAIQKHIIRRAAAFRKPVITATQMLESMIENPRPTRAEVSDVANAVYDGTDAVMLSGESAVGKYPVEAVSMMARIVIDAERHIKEERLYEPRERKTHLSIAETICEATAHAADDLDLRGIALFTESGTTARQLSKYHPSAPIFALSPIEVTINRLSHAVGHHAHPLPQGQHHRGAGRVAEDRLLSRAVTSGLAKWLPSSPAPAHVRLDQLPAPARNGRKHGGGALCHSPRGEARCARHRRSPAGCRADYPPQARRAQVRKTNLSEKQLVFRTGLHTKAPLPQSDAFCCGLIRQKTKSGPISTYYSVRELCLSC